jgi:sugar lactone lactonase YvrE
MRPWSQLRPDELTRRVDLPSLLAACTAVAATPVDGGVASLAEHPVWSDRHQGLVWVDIDAGRVLKTSASGLTSELFGSAGTVGAALPTAAGQLIVLASEGALCQAGEGSDPQLIAPPPPPGMRFNDAGLDPAGRLWAGVLPIADPAPGEPLTGELWRCDDAGQWHAEFGEMGCPNGIVWSGEGRTMLCCESDTRQIAAADYDPLTGQATNWRIAWEFCGAGDWVPDGLEWLPDGRLWVAFWGLGVAVRFTTAGVADLVIATQDLRTTSVGTAPDGRIWVTAAAGLSVAAEPSVKMSR